MREGDIVDGRFQLLSVCGAGGMGTVFRARDLSTGGLVALKTLRAGDAERFAREAETLALLDDPAIVRYVASSQTARYLAMEWLDGEDLAARLRRGPLVLHDVVTLGVRLATALAAAHGRGIIHRDLKPANVFLPGGSVSAAKLLDFGVARLPDANVSSLEGVVIGTLGYMAPEQARGELTVGAPADLFSLGVVLFEAITGRQPFMGTHAVAVLGKVLVEPAPLLSSYGAKVPRELEALLDTLLAKHPEHRPRNATLVVEQLDALDLDAPPSDGPRWLGRDERRLVSVVLVSPVATSHADTISSEDWTRRRIALSDVAARNGTHLDVMLGGTMLATLEGSGSLRAQAVRAARCALELHAASPDDVVVLATGRSSVGTSQPMGEVVDRGVAILRAVRGSSQSNTDVVPNTGRICIDELTAELLEEAFDVRHDEQGWFVVGPKKPKEKARHAIVGRGRELELLGSIFDGAVRESAAVLLVGPPGIGKSRLLHEAVARTNARVLQAAADPVGVASPFSLLTRMVSRLAGVRELVAEETAARLREWIEREDLPAEAEDGLSLLLGLTPKSPIVTTRAALIRAAVESVFERLCARGPVLLTLEDVHWADLPSLGLVDGLLRRLAPFMVLATARPEVAEVHPHLWDGRRVTELHVEPLSPSESESIVRMHGGETGNLAVILERAQGNPLFLQELARASGEGRDATIPATVVSVIEARLRSLSPDLRRVLRAGSIFGAHFSSDGALALLGDATTQQELEGPLEELVDREILVLDDASSDYRFGHALIAEAAHGMLTDQDRVLGHALAATWLESHGADSMTIAHHLEAGGRTDRAIELYEAGAEAALESGDHTVAIQRADRGLRCGAQAERHGALDAIAADAYQHLGDLEKAAQRGRAALAHLSPRSPYWVRASRAAIASGIARVRF